MNTLSTIVPIFIVVFLGLYARHRGFFSADFLSRANRLVYYIAIPAMIFSAISKASLKTEMNLPVIFITLSSLVAVSGLAWVLSRPAGLTRPARGSFIQCSFHGNLGYIGLAVAFYYLGNDGFVKTAIISGFVMILQNILAVFILQYFSRADSGEINPLASLKKTMANPVILSALAGIGFSLSNLPMPVILARSLDILKGMALPMALLIIGASLSFDALKPRLAITMVISFLKLMVTPALGWMAFRGLGISSENYLPGLILLASPTATLTYIMAREIGGDPDMAVAAISICTILSSLTYGIWLGVG